MNTILHELQRLRYRKWLIAQSVLCLALLAVLAFYPGELETGHLFLAIGLWLLTSHGVLTYSLSALQTAADVMTAFRCLLGVSGFLLAGYEREPSALVLTLVGLALVGDWIDGRLARAHGATEHGAIFDAETDQSIVMMLAVMVVNLTDMEIWILLFPAYRYVYILLLERFDIPTDNPKPKQGRNARARLVCAFTVIILFADLLPLVALEVKQTLSIIALLALTYSFADDIFYNFTMRSSKETSFQKPDS
jgi:phosphatidylglycerophosphate synthase